MKKMRVVLLSSLFVVIVGCAFNVIYMKQIPVQIETKDQSRVSFSLGRDVSFTLDTGYSRALKGGTVWHYVGSISQGDVYKTADQVLTVEGSNVHQAYIVIKNDMLGGFYLPVEKTFSPLSDTVRLSFQ